MSFREILESKGTRFGPYRVAADMEGNGELDLKVIFTGVQRQSISDADTLPVAVEVDVPTFCSFVSIINFD